MVSTGKWLNNSILSIERNPTDTTTPSQSEPGSSINKRVLHIPQSSKTGPLPSDGLASYHERS